MFIEKKMGRRNKSILKMELEALPSWDPTKIKWKMSQGTHLKESLKNGNMGDVLPSTKKQKKKKSSKNKHLKSDLCYRSTSSSLLTENSSPSPKKHKSRRKKRKHHKHSSFSSYSSLLFSSSESSETRSVVGTLGR